MNKTSTIKTRSTLMALGAVAALGVTTLAGIWYRGVCLTVFRFILLRWMVRFARQVDCCS